MLLTMYFFFNDTATTEIYTLSLHDALPISLKIGRGDVGHIQEHAIEAYPEECAGAIVGMNLDGMKIVVDVWRAENTHERSEEHTSELQSRQYLVCRLLLEKKKKNKYTGRSC